MIDIDRPRAVSDIGVVIVAHRSADTIVACVRSCLLDERASQVVVIDNSRDPATADKVRELSAQDGRLRYIGSGNIGFSAGCNLGVQHLGPTAIVAFVNPDVVLTRTLGELADRLEISSAAMISGRLTVPKDPSNINARSLPTPARELMAALAGAHRAYRARGVNNAPTAGESALVGQLAGALVLMHAATFQKLGGFDERFELYYEDVDLGLRSIPLGGSLLVNEGWGTHYAGHSARSASGLTFCVGTVSRIRYLRKVYGDRRATTALIAAIGLLQFAARSITRRNEGDAARRRALRLQWTEIRYPGTVSVLQADVNAKSAHESFG